MKTLIPKLFLALAWLALPAVVQAQFSFTTNNGAITITSYDTAAGLNAVIPAATNGYPVTSIGDDAFSDSSITGVTIPNSVTSIGNYVFEDCTSLASVTIGNGVTSIGAGAFYDCSVLTSVTIPNSVTSLGASAFYVCTKLTSVTIGSGVTSIGAAAFYDCKGLTSVTIPNSVTNLGLSAFESSGLISMAIPNSVTSIGTAAFEDCTSLANVTIGNGVTSIGASAFYDCSGLTRVTIPKSVTSIGESGFENCTKLTSVYFQGNAPPNDGTVFLNDPATVYYPYGTTGWGPTYDGVPAVLWNPQANALNFSGGHFGFNLTGPANAVIVVEACTNLAHAVWLPVATNTFSGNGTSTFSDLQSGAHPTRFYRERSP